MFELPEQLARLGHRVEGVTIAYHRRATDLDSSLITDAGVRWRSVDARPWPPGALLRYRRLIKQVLDEFEPEVLIGFSDAFHAIYAARLGRARRIPTILDLYDQFEAFGATRLPGVRTAFRNAVASSTAVTCVSPMLADWTIRQRGTAQGVVVLDNAVNQDLFFPRDRLRARRRLHLPPDAVLIGTAGSLMRDRDIATLYGAFERLSGKQPDLHLVVAGPRNLQPPRHVRVHDLQSLAHREVPWLFGALDVGVVCNADSLFARYCHPQKLVEMRACGLPVVLADTFAGQLRAEPGRTWLYRPGNVDELCVRLEDASLHGVRQVPPLGSGWQDRGRELDGLLRWAVEAQAGQG